MPWTLLRVQRDLGRDPRFDRSRATRGVDYVADFALIVQAHGDHVVELDARLPGNLDGPAQHHAGMPEDAVDAKPPGFVAGDTIRHLVRGPAVGSRRARVAGLIRRIVRNLGLIEISPAAVAVPQHLELLMVLDKEAVDGDVVAIDHQPAGAGIALPAHAGAVVGAPDPGVIDNGIVAVYREVDGRAAHPGTAHPEEDIVE